MNITPCIQSQTDFETFLKVDIRIGKILSVSPNEKAKNPAYILTIDFGPLGIKTSSAQITQHYSVDNLIGMNIVAAVNLNPVRVAGIKSEVLVLATMCSEKGTVLLQPERDTCIGARVL